MDVKVPAVILVQKTGEDEVRYEIPGVSQPLYSTREQGLRLAAEILRCCGATLDLDPPKRRWFRK